MPQVQVRLPVGTSDDKKTQLVGEITDVIVRVLGVDAARVRVAIEETDVEGRDSSVGGETDAHVARRKMQQQSAQQ